MTAAGFVVCNITQEVGVEEMIIANLVVEKIFFDVQCQGKQWEQTSSQVNCGMTKCGEGISGQREKIRRDKTNTNNPSLHL